MYKFELSFRGEQIPFSSRYIEETVHGVVCAETEAAATEKLNEYYKFFTILNIRLVAITDVIEVEDIKEL